jgi:hypothetical protein
MANCPGAKLSGRPTGARAISSSSSATTCVLFTHAVKEADADEHPGEPVQRAPALVSADSVVQRAHAGQLANGQDRAVQSARQDGAPSREDRPDHQGDQSEHADEREGSAEPGASRVGGEQDVGLQQRHAEHRRAPAPDRGAVDAVEPPLDPGQGADQDERDAHEQHRFGTEQLTNVASGWGS